MNTAFLKSISYLSFLVLASCSSKHAQNSSGNAISKNKQQTGFVSLFNGKNLEGWDIFLKDKGLNNDSEHNFQVEDGVIHVRGKELGYIRTKTAFNNYHFTVEFKWGEKKWPPRENAKRDAGICYNIPGNEPDSIWPKSIE